MQLPIIITAYLPKSSNWHVSSIDDETPSGYKTLSKTLKELREAGYIIPQPIAFQTSEHNVLPQMVFVITEKKD